MQLKAASKCRQASTRASVTCFKDETESVPTTPIQTTPQAVCSHNEQFTHALNNYALAQHKIHKASQSLYQTLHIPVLLWTSKFHLSMTSPVYVHTQCFHSIQSIPTTPIQTTPQTVCISNEQFTYMLNNYAHYWSTEVTQLLSHYIADYSKALRLAIQHLRPGICSPTHTAIVRNHNTRADTQVRISRPSNNREPEW